MSQFCEITGQVLFTGSKKWLRYTLFFYSSFSLAQNPINASYAGSTEGTNTDYYKNGQVENKCEIKNGNIQGDRYCYYKSGKLMVREQFDNGKFHGRNYSLNEAGDSLYTETYRHDSLFATQNWEYYKSGKLSFYSSTVYENDSTMRADLFLGKNKKNSFTLHDDKIEKVVHHYRMDKEFYESGKLKSIIEYKNGVYHGQYVLYHENGNKKQESSCANGKYEGPYFEYFPSGVVKIKTTNKNDYYDGEYFEYDKNGKLLKKIIYKEGIKQD